MPAFWTARGQYLSADSSASGSSASLHVLKPDAAHDPATTALIASLDDVQRAQLATYRDLLLEWNQRFNLTAVTEPAQVERRLLLDALRMLPAVDEIVATSEAPRLIDVGSGAGFPGMVLKIARPALDVTMVDATGKKVSFLTTAIEQLGLNGVTAIHARAEDLGQDPAYRERFDLATARAVASLPALLELCMPLVRVGGRALFPKSEGLEKESAQGRRAAPLVGAKVARVSPLPHAETERVTLLVVVDKMEPTPPRYPRRAGIPAREPLGKGSP
jgi:16S rRNA (guanine527-N7)-methyltransferase